jgi:hypothetical protein
MFEQASILPRQPHNNLSAELETKTIKRMRHYKAFGSCRARVAQIDDATNTAGAAAAAAGAGAAGDLIVLCLDTVSGGASTSCTSRFPRVDANA